jgi:hypothetical protein
MKGKPVNKPQLIIENNEAEKEKNELTVAPSNVPCSDPACLALGITKFFCFAFLRS